MHEVGRAVTSEPEPRIRTPDQRLRVFVSSTLRDLAEERHAVRRAIETLRLTPVMFELGARPYPPRALYRAYLEQSHVFLGVYWQSYGWVAPGEEISGLEDEYGLSAGRPRLVYLKEPAVDRQERLVDLLQRIEADDQSSYRRFGSASELEQLVKDDLMVLLSERFEAIRDRVEPGAPRSALTAPPVPITPTLGRETEIAAVQRLLTEDCRILTLVGPGGVGKSRLALEACRPLATSFPDGVAFVPLETVDDPSDAVRVLADRVGARGEGNQAPLDVAIDQLRRRRALLLLDNFEQILEAGPDLAALLDACPGVSALVTSRRPLRLRGERLMTVEPLGLPVVADEPGSPDTELDAALRSPAVSLFVERAQRVRPAFMVDRSNVEATADLVRRLDGLPLAIELAAARADLLEPGQMLERLEQGAGVPMSAGRDYPERQRTMRATLEWSHNLLTTPQQTLLARLGMFADGATLESIESVCSGAPVLDLLDSLSALLDNGLIRVDRQRREGQPRFVLLLTVREFALERLANTDDSPAVTARFIEWATETVARADPSQHRDAPDRWPELQVEARNLQRAAELLIDSGDCRRLAVMAWGMLHSMWRFGDIGVLARWAERALAACEDLPPGPATPTASARLRAAVSWSRFLVGDAAGALAVQEGLDLDAVAASDPACAALLQNTRAMALPTTDGGGRARTAAHRALALAESADFPTVRAYSHAFLASLDLTNRDFASAQRHCRQCLSIAKDLRLYSLSSQQHGQLALIAIAQGRNDEARRHFAAALDVLGADRTRIDVAVLLGDAAVLAAAEGRGADAARARSVSDAEMARLGLAHWHMFEDARSAALAAGGEPIPGGDPAETAGAVPWEVLQATLALRAPTPGAATSSTSDSRTPS